MCYYLGVVTEATNTRLHALYLPAGALSVENSSLLITGESWFVNNQGHDGGEVSSFDVGKRSTVSRSVCMLPPPSQRRIWLVENSSRPDLPVE